MKFKLFIISVLIFAVIAPISAQANIEFTTQYENIASLEYSPDGSIIATASFMYDENNLFYSSLQLWDVESGDLLTTVDEGENGVVSMDFSPDGSVLATGSALGLVTLWELDTLQPIESDKEHEFAPDVTFSNDGTLLISGDDSAIVVRDVETFEPLQIVGTSENNDQFLIRSLISPDGSLIAGVYDTPGRVIFWDIESGDQLSTLDTGYEVGPYAVDFVAQGEQIALAYDALEIWDVLNAELTGELAPSDTVFAFDYSPDGSIIATVDASGALTLWDASTYEELLVLTEDIALIWNVTFSPDSTAITVARGQGLVQIWPLG